jgi:beta-1,4-mannosyl-glycoprotein beta-1,4-N-acetylglucosaminyltransferase
MITDIDEIPSPDVLQDFRNGKYRDVHGDFHGDLHGDAIWNLDMEMYYYNLSNKLTMPWIAGKIMSLNYFNYLITEGYSASKIRNAGPSLHAATAAATAAATKTLTISKSINNGGWHMSFFGGSNTISNKIKYFAHQEYNTEDNTNVDNIEKKIERGEDVFGRDDVVIVKVGRDRDYLPKLLHVLETLLGVEGVWGDSVTHDNKDNKQGAFRLKFEGGA